MSERKATCRSCDFDCGRTTRGAASGPLAKRWARSGPGCSTSAGFAAVRCGSRPAGSAGRAAASTATGGATLGTAGTPGNAFACGPTFGTATPTLGAATPTLGTARVAAGSAPTCSSERYTGNGAACSREGRKLAALASRRLISSCSPRFDSAAGAWTTGVDRGGLTGWTSGGRRLERGRSSSWLGRLPPRTGSAAVAGGIVWTATGACGAGRAAIGFSSWTAGRGTLATGGCGQRAVFGTPPGSGAGAGASCGIACGAGFWFTASGAGMGLTAGTGMSLVEGLGAWGAGAVAGLGAGAGSGVGGIGVGRGAAAGAPGGCVPRGGRRSGAGQPCQSFGHCCQHVGK